MNPEALSIIVIVSVAGIGLIVVIVGLAVAVGGRGEVGERINQYVGSTSPTEAARSDRSSRATRLSRFRYRLNLALTILNSEEMERKINSAAWDISVTEFNLVRIVDGHPPYAKVWAVSWPFSPGCTLRLNAMKVAVVCAYGTEWPCHPTSTRRENVEHRTSNAQLRTRTAVTYGDPFKIRCWTSK